MITFALLLLVTIQGEQSAYVVDHGLTRADCAAALKAATTKRAAMGGADVRLTCEQESK